MTPKMCLKTKAFQYDEERNRRKKRDRISLLKKEKRERKTPH